MRVPMIAGNWKMNTTVSKAVELVREMHGGIHAAPHTERLVCPAGICLSDLEAGLDVIADIINSADKALVRMERNRKVAY